MQIKILLVSNKTINLPIAHRHAQQSLIYNALRSCPEYSQALHNYGFSEKTTGFKLFTFSPLEGSYTKSGKRLIFNGRVQEWDFVLINSENSAKIKKRSF